MHAAVLTVSDRSFAGTREDFSGPAIIDLLKTQGIELTHYSIVPDDRESIISQLSDWINEGSSNIIFTTGGTGFSPHDVTPEATKTIIERETPGISEFIRARSAEKTPHAILSRAVSGICKNCLIINLPGSPKAACESVQFIFPVLPHAIELLLDQPDSEKNH
ncbi:MAG: molybdenum cofactor biosynthesis protein [Chloroflexi bacterium 44-23]|nr:MAG: molybdenum cofactor biosynthesis protein [Chloroflexi bacterium 44-23]